MADWLSPEEREEFRAYNEKRYKEQHGACLAEITQLRGNLSLAEKGLANYSQENAKLREALLSLSVSAQRLSEEAALALARSAESTLAEES